MNDSEPVVIDVPQAGQYELHLDGDTLGFASYHLANNVMTIPHVETAPEHRGNGYADLLMAGIVDDVRSRGLTIRALCSFAASHMNDNPSTHDLIAS